MEMWMVWVTVIMLGLASITLGILAVSAVYIGSKKDDPLYIKNTYEMSGYE